MAYIKNSFLSDVGLSDIQIELYEFILNNSSGTIKELKEILNYSYSQVSYNLSILEEMGLIFSTKSKKDKRYYRIDPKIALTKLLNERVEDFRGQIEQIEEKLKLEESSQGVCLKNISFYHYSDLNLALNNYFELISNAKKEIIMSALPITIIKKLEPILYQAFMKGLEISITFSNGDFIDIKNYFDLITDVLKRIGTTITQTEERTCQWARFNDILVNVGVILIDDKYLNSVIFVDDNIFHFEGFYGQEFVSQSKLFLEIKTVEKRVRIDYPGPIQTVLDLIRQKKSIKTRELSAESKIGGGKLKEILNFLVNKNLIKELEIKGVAGKPRKEYSII